MKIAFNLLFYFSCFVSVLGSGVPICVVGCESLPYLCLGGE